MNDDEWKEEIKQETQTNFINVLRYYRHVISELTNVIINMDGYIQELEDELLKKEDEKND